MLPHSLTAVLKRRPTQILAPVGGKDLQPHSDSVDSTAYGTYCLAEIFLQDLTAKGLLPSPTSVGLWPPGLIAFATHCLPDL